MVDVHKEGRFVGDVVEVGTVENEDEASGKQGSDRWVAFFCNQPNTVCDVRKSNRSSSSSSTSVKQKDVRRQFHQLEDLLHDTVPNEVCQDADEYRRVRCRYALLRSFARKLQHLLDEANRRRDVAGENLQQLEREHPEYKQQYRKVYDTALRECGMEPKDVPFIHYLREEEE